MMLAIDIGNTNTLFALWNGQEWAGQWRLATDPRRTADEYAIWLQQMQGLANRPIEVDDIALACVVPQSLFEITRAIERHFGHTPQLVTSEGMAKTGMKILTEQPHEVGADRLINALAAWHYTRQPCIVLDFGTATTFDVVNHEGAYCGGVIAPGIHLSLDALHRAAAKLPLIGVSKPKRCVGRHTTEAMQSGVYYGYLGLIERLVREIKDEMAQEGSTSMKVLATGGLAPLFAKATPAIDELTPDLTIDGLRIFAELQQEKK